MSVNLELLRSVLDFIQMIIFGQERKLLLANGKDELAKQRERHSNFESLFVEKYVKLAQDYQQQLETMRSADGEEFNILKMR